MKEKLKNKEKLKRIAKILNVDRKTIENHYYFINDSKYLKKYGQCGNYNENEWK